MRANRSNSMLSNDDVVIASRKAKAGHFGLAVDRPLTLSPFVSTISPFIHSPHNLQSKDLP